jgi:hypothetical protein
VQGSDTERTWPYLLLAIGLFALAVLAVIFILRALYGLLTSTSPQLSQAIIGTGGLVTAAVIGNIGAKYLERRDQIRQEQRAKKAEVYDEFMKFWFRLLTGEESGGDEPSEDYVENTEAIKDYTRNFTHKLATWGSEPVLKEYIAFKSILMTGEEQKAILHFERVLLAIRDDLGYSNKGLERGDLIKIILDSDQIDTLIATEALMDASEATDEEPSENGKAANAT